MMEKKLMLFGFTDLGAILAAEKAAASVGAAVQAVPPRDCGLTIGEIAAGKTASAGGAPVVLPGQMVVLCGLDRELDRLLPALQQGGILCPKAVLTAHNRTWRPEALLGELHRERAAIARQRKER